MTHTVARLEVGHEAYNEIRQALIKAGYEDRIHVRNGGAEGINLSGLVLVVNSKFSGKTTVDAHGADVDNLQGDCPP